MVPALPQCTMNETKLEIGENYEETELSDVDDDVFVRSGGRNGYRLEYNDTAKKPLMAPRKKNGFDGMKNGGGFHTEVRSSPPVLKIICVPMCYILIATMAMLGIIALALFVAGHVRWPLNLSKFWAKGKLLDKVVPCDNIVIKDVWVQHFPKLLTESSFRTLDVNQDGVLDIVFGFATGVDGLDVPDFLCDIYFPGQAPCFGGVLALNGVDGSELWRHWTKHEVFAVNCNEDLNLDGQRDCLISGRAGVFRALDSKTGTALWSFETSPVRNAIMNIYTPQFVRDLNGDNIAEVIAIHGGDPLAELGSPNRLIGKLMLFDGKSGNVIQSMAMPDSKESYYSPQMISKDQDGSEYILFGSGSETSSGSLYTISLGDFFKGYFDKTQVIYTDPSKGIMVSPVITDVNEDSIDDIVLATFNSNIMAFDGSDFQLIWNYTFPDSETYTTPTPGYYNDDDVPDFLVKYQNGPGFPIYYSAETTILDGKTGKPILNESIIDSIGTQASTPVVRVEGLGNDIFLYWSSNCRGYEGNNSAYQFAKGTHVREQSRSDFCKLRFDAKMINQLRAVSDGISLPGTVIYDSDVRSRGEYNMTVDTSVEGQNYLQTHPEMWKYVGQSTDSTKQDVKDAIQLQQDLLNFDQYLPAQTGNPYQDFSNVQFLPMSVYGQTYGAPESITDQVKYPQYHNVRKHGNGVGQQPPQTGIDGIQLNRRPFGGDDNTQDKYGEIRQRMNAYNGAGAPVGAPQQQQLPPYSFDPAPDSYGGSYGSGGARWKRDAVNGRFKRHIPEDTAGVQRLISTGTLVPPLNPNSTGIDFVFATYWFYPAKTKLAKNCRDKKLEKRSSKRRKAGLEEDEKAEDCADDLSDGLGSMGGPQATYNPFDLHMGQMSVYRLHLDCTCEKYKAKGPQERCSKILPFADQGWAAHMGTKANSYFPKMDVRKEVLRFLKS